MAYEDTGGSGPVIVFVHGLFNSKEMWRPQVDYFSSNYSVITYDLRGHGQSDIGVADFSVQLLAGDLLKLLDHVNIGAAVICGFSLGGCVAQIIAATHPERLIALAISDSFQGRRVDGRLTSVGKRLLGLTFGVLPARYTVALLHLPTMSMKPEVRQELLGIARANLSRLSTARKSEIVSSLIDFEYQDLSRFSKPAQLMVGAKEPFFLRQQARALLRELPHAELELIPGAQHGPNLENIGAFNAAIDSLLAKIEGSGRS